MPDGQPIGADLVPSLDQEPLRFKEIADAGPVPADQQFQNGNRDRDRIGAQNSAPCNLRHMRALRDSDGKSIAGIHMQHDVNVGAAIPDIDNISGPISSLLWS